MDSFPILSKQTDLSVRNDVKDRNFHDSEWKIEANEIRNEINQTIVCLTCTGNLSDPNFSNQLNTLLERLKNILPDGMSDFCLQLVNFLIYFMHF